MRKRKLSLITLVLVTTLAMSCLAVLSATNQNKSVIISKLEELRDRVKAERPALENKVNAVIHQIEAGAYHGALNKLQNDVKKSILAWVDDPEDLIRLVDEIIDLIKGITPPLPPAPDFKVTADHVRLEIEQGNSDTANITITSKNGFNQEVTLTNSTTAPSGVRLSLNPSTLTPPPNESTNSTLIVEVSADTEPDDYTITVTATSGSLTRSVQLLLRVVAAPPPPPHPDFSISANPSALTIQKGDSDSSVITITSVEGFNQPVDLAVTSNQIEGITTSLNPTQVTPPSGSSEISVLTIDVAPDTSPGSYTILITGNSGTLTHSTTISLEVVAPPTPPAPDFSVNTSPATLTVDQGNSATSTIIVVSLRGFSQSVDLAVTWEPINQFEATIDPLEVTPEPNGFATSTLTVTVGKTATPNDYVITVTGTNGTITRTAAVSLKIVAEKTPPEIVSVLRLPETPSYNQTVTILTSITDAVSGIQEAILSYSHDTTEKNVTMTQEAGGYTANIPAMPFATLVSYSVLASDKAGNWAESDIYSYIVDDPYPPVIGVPSWSPLQPAAFEAIAINVTVSEPVTASGVDRVLLSYKNKTMDEWLSLPMVLKSGNWTITLKDQVDTTVEFSIMAVDTAGNSAESPEQGFTVSSPVGIPLAWILAAILAIASVIGGSAYYVRKQKRKASVAMPSVGLYRRL